MRIIFYLTALFCILFIYSCGEDSPTTPTENNPIVMGYDPSEAAQCMTLSTLAYVNENNPSYIKDSLIYQLGITNYATAGKWKLA